jgi:hypothetical protein
VLFKVLGSSEQALARNANVYLVLLVDLSRYFGLLYWSLRLLLRDSKLKLDDRLLADTFVNSHEMLVQLLNLFQVNQ